MLRSLFILIAGFCLVAFAATCDAQTAQRPPAGNPGAKSAPRDNAAGSEKTSPDRQTPGRPVYRPDDLRPERDAASLAADGIHLFESRRLKLYTDVDDTVARTLPPLVDQLYVALEAYFGPMPPDRAGTDYQMSGFLMKDANRFRKHELMPDELVIEHGRHRRNEFWMWDQKSDYYRRHLAFHEATHCFMTCLPDSVGPVWYMEGLAEYFAVHQLNKEHRAQFRLMPGTDRDFAGFARIATIRDEVAEGKLLTIDSILAFKPDEFVTVHYYAWSWALCLFLDQNPRYAERFRSLGKNSSRTQFNRQFNELFERDRRDLETEWALFAANLQYGYDVERAAIEFRAGEELKEKKTTDVKSDRGWQSSGVLVKQGDVYKITATGQFTLGNQPKPWVSEAQGISFRYFDGRPMGTLLGCIRTEQGPAGGSKEPMLDVFAVGREYELRATEAGTLYFRLNDAWNSLVDNQGSVRVVIQKPGP
jgi:hypothetical protein